MTKPPQATADGNVPHPDGASDPEDGPEPSQGRRLRVGLGPQELMLLVVLIAMVAFFTALNPRFFSSAALANILQDWAPIMLLGIAETFVIVTAGIDLSVGSTLGLSGVSAALTVRSLTRGGADDLVAIAAGVVVALAVGLAVGIVNGLLITKVRLAPFIATLSTLGAAAGLTLVITGGVQIAGGPATVIDIGTTRVLWVLTTPVLVVLAILALAWTMFAKTRFGRWTKAIGSNSFAARGSGVPVDRHLMKVYALSGILAALAGLFVYFRLGSGSPTSGRGMELTAIAAAVIGGASLFGGRGRMAGTVLGALITTAVLSGLILIGVAPQWQEVVIGVLIAVAVGAQQVGPAALRAGAHRD